MEFNTKFYLSFRLIIIVILVFIKYKYFESIRTSIFCFHWYAGINNKFVKIIFYNLILYYYFRTKIVFSQCLKSVYLK